MKHVLIATTVVVSVSVTTAAAAVAATSAPTSSDARRGSPPCTPKVTKIKGQPAAVGCGPATATVHIGGKTYTFHKGFCEQSKAGRTALQLDLGTAVPTAKGNAGQPHLQITVLKDIPSAKVDAAYGGKLIANGLVVVSGKVPAGGTFKSKFSGPGFGSSFTGSWNCHGVVWQAP